MTIEELFVSEYQHLQKELEDKEQELLDTQLELLNIRRSLNDIKEIAKISVSSIDNARYIAFDCISENYNKAKFEHIEKELQLEEKKENE